MRMMDPLQFFGETGTGNENDATVSIFLVRNSNGNDEAATIFLGGR
jgi:hypothetical protein